MKKNVIRFCLVFSIIATLPFASLKLNAMNINMEVEENSWDTIKKEKAVIDKKTENVLKAYGITSKEMLDFTKEDIHDILVNGTVIHPEYLDAADSLSTEKRIDIAQKDSLMQQDFFKTLGYSDSEIMCFLENGIREYPDLKLDKTAYDILLKEIQNTSILEQESSLYKNLNNTRYLGDHIVHGVGYPYNILDKSGEISEPDGIEFHYDTFKFYYNTAFATTYPLEVTSGEGFLKKKVYMTNAVAAAGYLADGLYNSSPGGSNADYNFNMFGEKSLTYIYHEGVDLAKGRVPIYAPDVKCYVTGKSSSPNSGYTYINLYMPDLGFTMVVEHIDWSNYQTLINDSYNNQTDISGLNIAIESNKSAPNRPIGVHTHVEFRTYKHTGGVATNGDDHLICYDPTCIAYLIYD